MLLVTVLLATGGWGSIASAADDGSRATHTVFAEFGTTTW